MASSSVTASSLKPQSASSPMRSASRQHVSYETYAPRSTAQVSRLSRLAALTAGPVAASGTTTRRGSDTDTATTEDSSFVLTAMSPPPLPDEPLETGTVYKSDNVTDATLQETLQVSDQLTQRLKHTTSLRLAVRASLNIGQDLSNRHAELLRHSGELSAAAERLQQERDVLMSHAQDIGQPLQHYNAVDRMGVLVGVLFKPNHVVVRGLPKVQVDDEDEFPIVLDDIDAALDFFERAAGGRVAAQQALQEQERLIQSGKGNTANSGNMEYYRRALALQQAALALLRQAVTDRIATTSTQIAAALNLKTAVVPADQLEASLLYTRFHGISSRSNRLLALVRARMKNNHSSALAYKELLQTCRHAYCVNREALLRSTIQAHMDLLLQQHGPVGMTRLASVFLIRLCTVETSLYLDFFGDKPKVGDKDAAEAKDGTDDDKKIKSVPSEDNTAYDSEFQSYLAALCSALHRTVRRSLVTLLDLDTLCQIVSVLREERTLATQSPTTMAAARAVSSVIQDAQERLIFCANTILTKEVVRFKPTPQDLDYPRKLEVQKKKDETAEAATEEDEETNAVERQLEKVYESWFPPMRAVLRVLSKIFRVVEAGVFEDMALQSVQACTQCLQSGAAYIEQRKGVMHSDLFLVKHLLILREQLSPFDMELRSVERQLDFSDAGKAVARFLASRNRRLFSMSTENALFTLLSEGVSVQESSVDSKRDLEDALRTACNNFIEHTVNAMASDLTNMVEQCKTTADQDAKKALLQADAVISLLSSTLTSVQDHMAIAATQMSLYLDNPATQSILLKPVSRKVTRALEEIQKWMTELNQSKSNKFGWEDEKVTEAEQLMQSIKQAVSTRAK